MGHYAFLFQMKKNENNSIFRIYIEREKSNSLIKQLICSEDIHTEQSINKVTVVTLLPLLIILSLQNIALWHSRDNTGQSGAGGERMGK